jgi:hypothetical protein
VTGCIARRIQIRVERRTDTQTLSASVDMSDRDRLDEEGEGAIQIATEKTINLHLAIEVEAVRLTMEPLRIEMLFLKDYHWR